MDALFLLLFALIVMIPFVLFFQYTIIGAVRLFSKYFFLSLFLLIFLPVIFVIWAFIEGING